MKKLIKKIISQSVTFVLNVLRKFGIGRYTIDLFLNQCMNHVEEVECNGTMKFVVPNSLNLFRIGTFATKEPETLRWIEKFKENSILWDIGANIGLYSVYAAIQRNCNVYAFEPSVFNIELLARNIWLNRLTDKITIIPNPLSESLSLSKMKMTTTEWGGAMSSFGQEFGHDGKPIQDVFEFSTLGFSMIDAVKSFQIPQPDHIKMDVDGIEHLILKGGLSVLKKCKTILIEINDNFTEQARLSEKYLKQCGYVLNEKTHEDFLYNDDSPNRFTYNQIWIKK